jgi:hypothetical protein
MPDFWLSLRRFRLYFGDFGPWGDGMFCSNCGQAVAQGAAFCVACFSRPERTMGFWRAKWKGVLLLGAVAIVPILALLAVGASDRLKDEERHKIEAKHRADLDAMPLQKNLERAQRVIANSKLATLSEVEDANENVLAAKRKSPNNQDISKLELKVAALLALKRHAETVRNTLDIEAQVVCQMQLQRQLVAPSTADIRSLRTSAWQGHEFMFISDFQIDAQNSFGATLRKNYECQVLCPKPDHCVVAKDYEISR